MYYIYMLRCEDHSIYTGITTDLERRMKEHFEKQASCAKYTFTHTAYQLEMAWKTTTRVDACKLEYHIKKLNKKQKEALILEAKRLEEFLGDKLEVGNYQNIDRLENNKISKNAIKKFQKML